MVASHDFPPDLIEHWSNSDRPTAYYYFLGFGAVCVMITWYLLIPRIIDMYKYAIEEREKRGAVLIPFTYNAYLLILSFPVCATFLKYFTFISPISSYSVEFIMASYESAVLYSFTTLLIMYLGSVNMMTAFDAATPTKFYAAPPIGCCFISCITPATVSKQAFRKLHFFIIQCCVLLPLFHFALLVRGYNGAGFMYKVLNIFKTISVLICFYGLLALLRASHELLHQHNIHGKFWCIKGLILFMLIPPVVIGFIGHLPEQNETYNEHVMIEAYSAMVSLVCLSGLAVVFLKYFKPIDAVYALYNSDEKDYTASNGLIDRCYNASNINSDLKENEVDQTDVVIQNDKGQ